MSYFTTMKRVIENRRGLSFIELIMTMAILGILAMAIVPSTRMAAKRSKELELRRDLRIIRSALDDYKRSYDESVEKKKTIASLNKSGYPETLKELVEGKDFGGLYPSKKKFLRRIPVDPFNPPAAGEEPKWGLRSYTDDPESTNWGGDDVYDVYSLSEGTAIDGTKYKDW